jgi:hypothetical protein
VSWNFSEMMTMTTQSVHAHHPTSLSSYTTTEIAVIFAVVAVTVLLFLSAVHIVLCAVFHTGCTALENDSAYTTHPASSSQRPPPPSRVPRLRIRRLWSDNSASYINSSK